jgi:hypothetical protein
MVLTNDASGTGNGQPCEPRRELTVHALTEFVFCPRAGVLTAETRSERTADPIAVNLGFDLPYNLEELENTLNRQLNRIWVLSGLVAITLAGGAVAWWFGQDLWLGLCALVLLLVAKPISRLITAASYLVRLRAYVQKATAVEIDVTEELRQRVSWWDLLAAGWISVPCHEAYHDQGIGLSGAPWRKHRGGRAT